MSATIEREGYIEKRGSAKKDKKWGFKNWNERWMLLVPGTLFYFSGPHDTEPKGVVQLKKAVIDENPNPIDDRKFIFIIHTDEYELILSCMDQQDKTAWLESVKKCSGIDGVKTPPERKVIPKQNFFSKATKKIAGNAAISGAGQALIMEFVDDETELIIKTLEGFVIKDAGKEKAIELKENAIKIIVKIGLLFRNKYLNEDYFLKIRIPCVNILFLLMDFYEGKEEFKAEIFVSQLRSIQDQFEKLLHGLIRSKTIGRLKSLFDYFGSPQAITKAFKDPNYKSDLDALYKILKHLHEENLL